MLLAVFPETNQNAEFVCLFVGMMARTRITAMPTRVLLLLLLRRCIPPLPSFCAHTVVGYLVVSYMCSVLQMNLAKALECFAKARSGLPFSVSAGVCFSLPTYPSLPLGWEGHLEGRQTATCVGMQATQTNHLCGKQLRSRRHRSLCGCSVFLPVCLQPGIVLVCRLGIVLVLWMLCRA